MLLLTSRATAPADTALREAHTIRVLVTQDPAVGNRVPYLQNNKRSLTKFTPSTVTTVPPLSGPDVGHTDDTTGEPTRENTQPINTMDKEPQRRTVVAEVNTMRCVILIVHRDFNRNNTRSLCRSLTLQ